LTCSIGVRDLKAAIAWYQDVLGFQHLYTVDDIGWAELSTPVAKVNLGLGQVESVQPGGGATLTWGVSNIDTARADLERKRVRFDGPTMTIEGMVKLATFFDPDGNKHMFFQDLQTAH
jgi:catechol 2,3-dioxygenase-like lactoylglutathione lyase family enzyme